MSGLSGSFNYVYLPRRYNNILVLAFEIETLTELSVGGSVSDSILGSGTTDNPISKMPLKVIYKSRDKPVEEIVPYIPGSTLKGLLRTIAENIIKEKNDKESLTINLLDLISEFKKIFKEFKEKEEHGINSKEIYQDFLNNILSRIMTQYIDEEVVNKFIQRFSNGSFKDLYTKLSNKDELYREIASIVGVKELHDPLVEGLEEMIYSIMKNYKIYVDVCDPLIEGLRCQLPITPLKYYLLGSISRKLQDRYRINYPCRVCRIFGFPGYYSKIIVSDAYPVNLNDVFIYIRTHIAIDRIKGTVAHGKTFDIEYIAPGAKFLFFLIYHLNSDLEINEDIVNTNTEDTVKNIEKILSNIIEKLKEKNNVESENIELIRQVIERIHENPLQIGRRKTVGIGFVKINTIALSVIDPKRRPAIKNIYGKIRNIIDSSNVLPKPLKDLYDQYFSVEGNDRIKR